MAQAIPFGQPILVGHHSERGDRNYRDRIHNTMGRGIEDTRKAQEMARKADNIEAAAANAIYSDDPDAIERLTEKLERLTAERDAIKAENAAFRKAHREELKGMTAWERDNAMPHRAYEGQNLTGVITATRKRLEGLQRDQASPRASARWGRKGAYAKCTAECRFPYVTELTWDEATAIATEHNEKEHA
jgi:hypothetical protein